MFSDETECIPSCNLLNRTTCQLLSSNLDDPRDDIVRDEHGCYDPAITDPIPKSFKTYLEFFSSISAVTIGLSVIGILCNFIANQRVKEKLCNNFGFIWAVLKWSDRFVEIVVEKL